jgi:peptidoglycan/LPS O-acetylase OafA/YrhL
VPAAAEGRPSPHEHLPALDGVRALAVLGVMAYHAGVFGLAGGFFGVDAFFVLSGFLITTLLVRDVERVGGVRLGRFWARRARRLLPALVVLVLVVCAVSAWALAGGPVSTLRGDALSALFYVSNWWQIHTSADYFAATGPASPLAHTWSLAIEEQFYVVWPLVVLALARRRHRLGILLGLSVAGAAASALAMALLAGHGTDPTRLYYGTDTHAQSLLVGTALAAALAMARRPGDDGFVPRLAGSRARRLLDVLGLVGLAGSAVLWARLGGATSLTYRGGFLLVACCAAAVVLAAACVGDGVTARVLAVAPLRWLGRISYGVYLWHFPIFQWLDAARTGAHGDALAGMRLLATLAVATTSWLVLERPILRGLPRLAGVVRRLPRPASLASAAGAMAAVAGAVVAITATSATASSAVPAAGVVPAAPPAGAAARTRVLVEGDSTALTLSMALSVDPWRYGVVQQPDAVVDCGIAEGTAMREHGVVHAASPLCDPTRSAPAALWPAKWARDIAAFHPDVVVLLAGRWEVADRTYDGRWTDILDPTYAAYVEHQLAVADAVARAGGARLVALTAPCYSSGEQPDGSPWPEDDPARVAAYNKAVRRAAGADPAHMSVVDLFSMVCPGGTFHSVIGGVTVRAPDGIHFPYFTPSDHAHPDTAAQVVRFAGFIEPKLWPAVVAATHRTAPGA